MADIQSTYRLTLKDGMYYKVDGSPFPKPMSSNIAKGKLRKDGYKVTPVPVTGGHALRILKLENSTANEPTPEAVDSTTIAVETKQPTEGGTEKSIEVLRKELAELDERADLERQIAEKKQSATAGNNGTEPAVTKGSTPSGRPRRKSFDRSRLKFPIRPGYHRRVFNDIDGGMRIEQAIADGWEVVKDPFATMDSDKDTNRPSQIGSAVQRHVGTDNAGKPLAGVLMEIPQAWYDEGEAEKQAAVTKAEEGLRRTVKDGVTSTLTVSGAEDEVNRRI